MEYKDLTQHEVEALKADYKRDFQELNENFEYHIIFNSSVVENRQKLLDSIKTL